MQLLINNQKHHSVYGSLTIYSSGFIYVIVSSIQKVNFENGNNKISFYTGEEPDLPLKSVGLRFCAVLWRGTSTHAHLLGFRWYLFPAASHWPRSPHRRPRHLQGQSRSRPDWWLLTGYFPERNVRFFIGSTVFLRWGIVTAQYRPILTYFAAVYYLYYYFNTDLWYLS